MRWDLPYQISKYRKLYGGIGTGIDNLNRTGKNKPCKIGNFVHYNMAFQINGEKLMLEKF